MQPASCRVPDEAADDGIYNVKPYVTDDDMELGIRWGDPFGDYSHRATWKPTPKAVPQPKVRRSRDREHRPGRTRRTSSASRTGSDPPDEPDPEPPGGPLADAERVAP